MNDSVIKLSFWRYSIYISIIIMLLCGITYLLSSCEDIIIDNSHSGKMVKVRFSLDPNSFGVGEAITRSLNSCETESETVVIPLEDNLFLYATLCEEPVVNTRSLGEDQLTPGSEICIIAYKDNSTATTFSSIHTVQADGSLNPGELEVEENEDYTFVAFGYNNGTEPLPFFDSNHRAIVVRISDFMFICGILPDIRVNSTFPDVHIPMKRMYSTVKVEVSTNLGEGAFRGFQAIGPANISPAYSTPAYQFPEGTISQTLPEYPWELEVWDIDSPNTRAITQNQVFVTPAYYGSQIRVEFTSLTIGGKTFPQNTDEALPAAHFWVEPNKNYTLQVRFSTIDFAVSNIYWDDIEEKLTFERAVADGGISGNPDNKQFYQGVYFKFGSLVGISPREANFDTGSYLGSDGTPIYVPDNINAKTWKKTNTTTAYGVGATWNDILTTSSNIDIPRDPNNRYVMESAQNQPNKLANWQGDICQYIDNRYRLPTAYELWGAYEGDYALSDHYYRYEDTSSGWQPTGSWMISGSVNDSGTGIWDDRGATLRNAFFPASEYLTGTGSWIIRTLYWEGAYWTGSLHVDYNNHYGAYVKFTHDHVTLGDFFYATDSYAMPIRCVRK